MLSAVHHEFGLAAGLCSSTVLAPTPPLSHLFPKITQILATAPLRDESGGDKVLLEDLAGVGPFRAPDLWGWGFYS